MLWQDTITENNMRSLLANRGVRSMHVKFLKRNHNSKNQVYLAGDLAELVSLKIGEIWATEGTSRKRTAKGSIYHAYVPWVWIGPDGDSPAPTTQVAFYPQYPEVRLSGFLRGSPRAPSALMSITRRGQEEGRVLVFGTGIDDKTYGMVLSNRAPAAKALDALERKEGGLLTLPVNPDASSDSRASLIRELAKIHNAGWLDAVELPTSGLVRPCRGPRCVGHTLEAHLGIPLNGNPSPDFGEWEVKAHGVNSFERPGTGAITLFTPEPDLGPYFEYKSDWFVRKYGIPRSDGKRYDFTGIHKVTGAPHMKTNLELKLIGYDAEHGTHAKDGHVALVASTGELVSGWSFTKLLKHWQGKHAHAAYVPSQSNKLGPVSFRYGHRVHLAEGTGFNLFLRAMNSGAIYYDPGINSQLQDNGSWRSKARSQFRINVRSLSHLYNELREVDVIEQSGSPSESLF